MHTDTTFGKPAVEAHPDQRLAIVTVPIAGDPAGPQALAAVHTLRDTFVPRAFNGVDAHVLVGGAAATNVDVPSRIFRRLRARSSVSFGEASCPSCFLVSPGIVLLLLHYEDRPTIPPLVFSSRI